MFCDNCGTELKDETVFCYKCGTKVDGGMDEEIFRKDSPHINKRFKFIIPIICFIFAIIFNLLCYVYESKVTARVENMRQQAEELALKDKISEAANLIDSALALRPNNKTLQSDKIVLKDGKNVDVHITNVESYIKKQDYTKALSELDISNKEIVNNSGSFYDMLNSNIENKRTGVTILQIKSEMNNKNSIDELNSLLVRVAIYNVVEAKDTAEAIKIKIVDISYNKANEFLKKNGFSDAQAAINEGLKYDANNKKLLSFKDSIEKHKQDFELQEKNRIEQAMVSAAKEDENNRTNALEILETKTILDEYGDCVISGQAKNIATKSISSIQIYFTIYDIDNNELGTDYAYISPDYLEVNGTGNFETVEYGMPNADHIKVTNTTWYIR
ncbi:zinc ribbon domain-containing protein [Clostridium estertheticum]|uniref:FxLYD domain-containing protein n=1 Tax=Clostridium estertheticum TaxID=238834 RepID=UPI0013E97361|nr:FxLYD domain-containing protein [Clostridium estertheticum]MBZ9685950.1 zinc ribbon domain-containing protein [Clostridium estertheticum]